MKWITRERPKIDRIACPWLIKNFVDPAAEFIYVPKDHVFEKARELGAIPYDIPGAEYSHYGEECTFDYIVKKHELTDPAVLELATIVRGADTDHFDLAPRPPVYGPCPPDYLIILPMILKCWKWAWYYTRRYTVGASMCTRRSTPGNHFEGHKIPGLK
jgi:hypothetical protein